MREGEIKESPMEFYILTSLKQYIFLVAALVHWVGTLLATVVVEVISRFPFEM